MTASVNTQDNRLDNKDALEAHFRHELNKIKGKGLKTQVQEEVGALFEWFDTVHLKDLTSSDAIWAFFHRHVVERPLPDELPVFVTECAMRIRKLLGRDKTHAHQILSKKLFDGFAQSIHEMDGIRNEIISQVVSSTVFSLMIAETLYAGIKNFVFAENIIMRNIPGASSLLSAGTKLLNLTTLGISGSITDQMDHQIKKFVKGNIQKELKNSEQFLIKTFSGDLFRKSADEIWRNIAKYDSQAVSKFIEEKHIDQISPLVVEFWLEFRKTHVFQDIARSMIDSFFQRYGKINIRSLLEMFGITEAVVLAEVDATLVPILETDVVRGYIERRIRKRLGDYYCPETPALKPLLHDKKPAAQKKPASKGKASAPKAGKKT